LAQTFAVTALIRYDAARKAIASAYRVDEAKKIRDKAEAVRTYAKLAGDLDMQNMAAEIRIRAERRAGQLLSDMEKNPGTRGEGRARVSSVCMRTLARVGNSTTKGAGGNRGEIRAECPNDRLSCDQGE
jgi:hypothetical protein